jgi:uncharacterized protein
MRIAIIGSGIAGNAAAYALATGSQHAITIYEQADQPGGHSATVTIDYAGKSIAVDTGFIVYNTLNYPGLTRLFAHLGVVTQNSAMGFAISAREGAVEWAGRDKNMLDGLFARRRNLISPSHLSMLWDMLRFNKRAVQDRRNGIDPDLSLRAYLDKGHFSQAFRQNYLLPMGAAIWSMPIERILDFPAASFIAFLDNHRLLHWTRPVWRTVSGGSRAYVERLTAAFREHIRLNTRVTAVLRHADGIDVIDATGGRACYDHVIMASHSDQSLAMLHDPSEAQRAILSAIRYRDNAVYLHRDSRLMPQRKAAWAAWNVLDNGKPDSDLCVSYWMNALQDIDPHRPLFVTLNPVVEPDPAMVFGRYTYAHPQYDQQALQAQKRLPSVQGEGGLWFCGAWTGYGFHEDGLVSGLRVAARLGAQMPWLGEAVSLDRADLMAESADIARASAA